MRAGFWDYFAQCKEGGAGESPGYVKKSSCISVKKQEIFSQTACPPPPAPVCVQDRWNGLVSDDRVLRIRRKQDLLPMFALPLSFT